MAMRRALLRPNVILIMSKQNILFFVKTIWLRDHSQFLPFFTSKQRVAGWSHFFACFRGGANETVRFKLWKWRKFSKLSLCSSNYHPMVVRVYTNQIVEISLQKWLRPSSRKPPAAEPNSPLVQPSVTASLLRHFLLTRLPDGNLTIFPTSSQQPENPSSPTLLPVAQLWGVGIFFDSRANRKDVVEMSSIKFLILTIFSILNDLFLYDWRC